RDPGDQADRDRRADRLLADPAVDEREQIADQQVLDRQEAVQRPDVDVLPAVARPPRLAGSDTRPRPQLDVGVVADDVRVAVVQLVVLDPPQVRARPERVGRPRQRAVEPFQPRERAVVGIVHHACGKRDGADDQQPGRAEPNEQTEIGDDQRVVRGSEHGGDHHRLAVQPPPGRPQFGDGGSDGPPDCGDRRRARRLGSRRSAHHLASSAMATRSRNDRCWPSRALQASDAAHWRAWLAIVSNDAGRSRIDSIAEASATGSPGGTTMPAPSPSNSTACGDAAAITGRPAATLAVRTAEAVVSNGSSDTITTDAEATSLASISGVRSTASTRTELATPASQA